MSNLSPIATAAARAARNWRTWSHTPPAAMLNGMACLAGY